MNEDQGPKRVYIDCFDAQGLYEENYERIVLIMEALASSLPLKREWVSSQAVGGSWARSIRVEFETGLDPMDVKALMVGLEYCSVSELPDGLRTRTEGELFRFADIDVIELKSEGGISGRLKLGQKKLSLGELRANGLENEFVLKCRESLLGKLNSEQREKLINCEQAIFRVLERTYK
ncbi:MAG: hypothetical protein JSW61_00555 [Candidatus Thorarchaeota archaeon]|nr:MAG: hypothetical protein JSW61_00555 [Candidatus Thorarchaeota archaeon]